MLPTKAILKQYPFVSQGLMDIVLEIRNIVAEVTPDANEEIQPRGLVYYEASRGGHVSANICQIIIQDDRIRLAFIQGVFLPDPHGLLRSEGERIAKRFIDLHDFDKIPWQELKELIRASAAFDPYIRKG